ncbi:MAG: branched-chain amino acid ABC transporter permease [Ignisphaera sp.]
MDPILFIQVTVNGLCIGLILALVALGLSLTFGKLKIINLSHLLFYALGAYIVYTSSMLWNNFLYGILIGFLVCFTLGALSEIALRRLYGKSIEYTLICTQGLLFIGTDFIKRIWGLDFKAVVPPSELRIIIPFLEMEFYRIFVALVCLISFLTMTLFFKKTMWGKIIVAFIDNDEHLQAIGINPNIATLMIFAIGSALAALGGGLHAPISAPYPYMAMEMTGYTFATIVVGGLGSIMGTIVGGIVLGLAYAYSGFIQPYLSPIVVFVTMFIILVLRPEGLLGSRT